MITNNGVDSFNETARSIPNPDCIVSTCFTNFVRVRVFTENDASAFGGARV